jgi:hypothetical protein
MAELYFNFRGRTHTLRVRPQDHAPNEPTVWEGLVDGLHYVYAELDLDLEDGTQVWNLFEALINAYREQEMEVVK